MDMMDKNFTGGFPSCIVHSFSVHSVQLSLLALIPHPSAFIIHHSAFIIQHSSLIPPSLSLFPEGRQWQISIDDDRFEVLMHPDMFQECFG